MTITGIHHVQITIPVGQEAAARQFYCGLLGLPEIPKPESIQAHGGFWVQAGDRSLHIGTEDGVNRHATKAHIAYQVDNLNTWRTRFTAEGITFAEDIPLPGFDRIKCHDPFGNQLEFIQELTS